MHRLRCVLILFILTTFTQTPRDMHFIPDVSVHYTIFIYTLKPLKMV